MNIIFEFIKYISSADSFAKILLLVVLIIYTLFALILTFQIFSFNRLMEQESFAPIFKTIAILHAALSFILLLLVVFSL